MRTIKTFENDITEYKSNVLITSNFMTNKITNNTRTEYFMNKSGVYSFIFTTVRPDMESRDALLNERRVQIMQYAISTFMYSKDPASTLEENAEKVFNYVTFMMRTINERLQSLEIFKEA